MDATNCPLQDEPRDEIKDRLVTFIQRDFKIAGFNVQAWR
jgi:hypothetical protein